MPLPPTMTPNNDPSPAGAARAKFSPRRLVPLIVIAVAAGVVIAMGWQTQLSFETLERHYEALRAFIAAHEVVRDRGLCRPLYRGGRRYRSRSAFISR